MFSLLFVNSISVQLLQKKRICQQAWHKIIAQQMLTPELTFTVFLWRSQMAQRFIFKYTPLSYRISRLGKGSPDFLCHCLASLTILPGTSDLGLSSEIAVCFLCPLLVRIQWPISPVWKFPGPLIIVSDAVGNAWLYL